MQGVSFIPAMIGLFAISGAIKYYVERWKEKQVTLTEVNTENDSYNIFKGVGCIIRQRKGGIFRSGSSGHLLVLYLALGQILQLDFLCGFKETI